MNVDEIIEYLYARSRFFMETGNTVRGEEYLRVAKSFDDFFMEREQQLNNN